MDRRDRAEIEKKWYVSINDSRCTATVNVTTFEDDSECEEEIDNIPIKFEVCNLCNGKGTHVNPGIDSHGLTSEDFDQDPGFKEEYLAGTYDVSCYECGGKRVIPIFDEERASNEIKDMMKKHLEHIREYNTSLIEDAHTRFMENGGYY